MIMVIQFIAQTTSQLSACLRKLVLPSLLLLVHGSIAAENSPLKTALVIYGSQDISLWEQEFNENVLSNMPSDTRIRVTLEFLSLSIFDSDELRAMAENLRVRRRALNLDLVVAVLPAATTFLHEFGDIFAGDAERLYILPSAEVAIELRQDLNSTVLESGIQDATINTLQVMPQLLPDLQQVYVLGGDTAADRSYLSRVATAINEAPSNLDFTYLRGLPPAELIAALTEAPANSAILLSTYDGDSEGRIFRTGFITSLLSDNVSIPIFALYNSVMGTGSVVGGKITSARLYGEQTAKLAMSLMFEEPAIDTSSPPTAFIFDAVQLDRFDISRNRLPEGSVLINDNQPLWQEYLLEIVIGLFTIILQAILILALFQAIRRQKKAEMKLRRTHKMEALGNLSGGVAHDFNNVLMAIVGNAEIANMYMDDDPVLAKNHLSKLLAASTRAQNLIAQILMFSRQSEEEDLVSTNLSNLLEETIELIRTSAGQNIRLDVSCVDNLWNLHANASQIQQVLMNLCNNAQHAMEDRGTISVTAANQHLDSPKKLFQQTLPAGEYVSIAIADTGVGINQENISRIFEPFFTTKPQGKGTGLGLALVYGIIKAHGGYLDLQSTVGKGTTITLYLPANKEAVTELEQQETSTESQGNQELILLIDDDEMVVDTIERILLQLGYRVEPFTKPVKALHRFKSRPAKFDLIFSDLSMPEMDGVRLISNIREIRPDIPAILSTGFIDSFNQLEAEKLSNLTMLKKPCSVAEIATATGKTLGIRQRLHDASLM